MNQQCRVRDDLNAYQAELERQERDEFKLAKAAQETLAEAAQETLAEIDKTAEQMMKGVVFIDEKRSNGKTTYTEHSLAECGYECDDLYGPIERKFASGVDVLTAAADLRTLMARYCRKEAALYVGEDIGDLESLVRKYRLST